MKPNGLHIADRAKLVADWNAKYGDDDTTYNSIESWGTRLALRQNTLTKQFTAMETALQQMNSQSSWLTSRSARKRN